MLLERSELVIAAGRADDFILMMTSQGIPLLKAVPGVAMVGLGRGVENPDKFLLLIEWRSMADHTAFNKAAVYPGFLALIQCHAVDGAMEHFEFDSGLGQKPLRKGDPH